ncbi:MAG: class II aldolase/adducin family protein [Syntrophomonas sp.]|nr:class II aldolase/adducin family protein [Syntrophomonas sp.]
MEYLSERREVLKTAQEISAAKMVTGTWGNVSRKADNQPLMLITPSGMNYGTMSIEDIVLVDYQGRVVEGKFKPSVESPLHAAIYCNRPDVGAVVHVHSTYATAFAVAGMSIPVILEETAQIVGHEIMTAPYAKCGSDDLAAMAVQTLGAGNAVLLANHGLIGVGKRTADALQVCYIAEKTAKVALLAKVLGGANTLSPEETKLLNENFRSYGQAKV